MLYAAWLKDADRPHHKEAAMAKLFASETAASICDQAARVLASYGYAMEYPVQRYLRDVRFTLIGGGTSEILKLVIAKELSGDANGGSRCCSPSPASTATTRAPRWSCAR